MLEDIRRVGRNISIFPKTVEDYIPEEEEMETYSEPVIEEEEPQEFDQEIYGIQSAATAEEDEVYDLSQEESFDNEEEQYSNYYEAEAAYLRKTEADIISHSRKKGKSLLLRICMKMRRRDY